MRPLTTCLITPSVDLSQLAEQHQRDMPYLIQYFVSSLGRDAAACADLMSYLLFTSNTRMISLRLAIVTRASESMRSKVFSTLPMMGETEQLLDWRHRNRYVATDRPVAETTSARKSNALN